MLRMKEKRKRVNDTGNSDHNMTRFRTLNCATNILCDIIREKRVTVYDRMQHVLDIDTTALSGSASRFSVSLSRTFATLITPDCETEIVARGGEKCWFISR